MMEYGTLRDAVYVKRPGESLRVPKTEMAELPAEFEPTPLGTPLWIAHPGSVGQYRAPDALHAYEMEDSWEVHRDRFDPKKNPTGHFLLDAPELPVATLLAAFAGVGTYLLLDAWDARKSEEDGEERPAWVRAILAVLVGIVVFVLAYVGGALLRVHLGAA